MKNCNKLRSPIWCLCVEMENDTIRKQTKIQSGTLCAYINFQKLEMKKKIVFKFIYYFPFCCVFIFTRTRSRINNMLCINLKAVFYCFGVVSKIEIEVFLFLFFWKGRKKKEKYFGIFIN